MYFQFSTVAPIKVQTLIYSVLCFCTLMNNYFVWVILFQKSLTQKLCGNILLLLNSTVLGVQAMNLKNKFDELWTESLNPWDYVEISGYIIGFLSYWQICTNIFRKSNHDVFQRMKKTLIRQTEFKLIFDNIEESLVILNDQMEMVFVNDKFLFHFQRVIKKFSKYTSESLVDELGSLTKF